MICIIHLIEIPVIVGICLCVGYVIKKWVKDVDNKYIPTVCALLGVILSIWISGWNVSPAVILSGYIYYQRPSPIF